MRNLFNPALLHRISTVFLLCLCCNNAQAELVIVWNELTLRAIRYANIPPPVAVRQIAVVHASYPVVDFAQEHQ